MTEFFHILPYPERGVRTRGGFYIGDRVFGGLCLSFPTLGIVPECFERRKVFGFFTVMGANVRAFRILN